METIKPSWMLVRGYVNRRYLTFWLPGRLKLYDEGPRWNSEYGVVRVSTSVRDDDVFFEKMMFIFDRVKWGRRKIIVPWSDWYQSYALRFGQMNKWVRRPFTCMLVPREGKYAHVPEATKENFLRFAHGEELL